MLNKKEYDKKRYQKNKEKILEHDRQYRKDNPEIKKEWYIKNREKILEQKKKYHQENREHHKEYNKQWRINNKKRVRENFKQYERIRRGGDPKYSIGKDMSTVIRRSLKGNKNGHHWETLVGYTCNDLIKHLRRTIPKDYNWNDYIKGILELDHIIPISVFNFKKPEDYDFKRCWALTNLRLLPKSENRIKRNKLERPFQPALTI
ncbi:hypothetical protein ES708_32519 [subsurface metagenome]